MPKLYALLNLLSTLLVIGWNGYANSGNFNGRSVGELSAEYGNLFTPATYAFGIWGLIFVALLALSGFGIKRAFFGGDTTWISQLGPWLFTANVLTSLWVYFWLSESIAASVIVMVGILLSLIAAVVALDMERWDAPIEIIAFVWWPICAFSGWITVATIANVSAWLPVSDFTPTAIMSETAWTIAMIAVAVLVNLFMIASRNMREFALVGVWALVAIAVRHWGSLPGIAWSALLGALILFAAAAVHGYRNRATAPHLKWQQRRAGLT